MSKINDTTKHESAEDKDLTWYQKFEKKQKERGSSPQQIEAERVVKNYMMWTGAAGVIPVPVVDVAAIAAFQLAMLRKITKIYERHDDVKYTDQWGKEVIGSLISSIAATSIGHSIGKNVIKSIPVIGGLASVIVVPGFAAASTWALGQVFITHFESGGTILTFDPIKVKTYFHDLFSGKKKDLAGG